MSAKKITHIALLACVLITLLGIVTLRSAKLFTAHAGTKAQAGGARPTNDFARDRSVVLYVSAPDGNDNWSGRFPFPNFGHTDGPVASLDHAREVVRAIDKSGLTQVLVLFRGGTYYLSDTVTFRPADSGSADTEIVYRNFPGESPV